MSGAGKMRYAHKHVAFILILGILITLLTGCNLDVLEIMNVNDEQTDADIEWYASIDGIKQDLSLSTRDKWEFDEKEFIKESKKWTKDIFTTDSIVSDKTSFKIKGNSIFITELPRDSDYDGVLLSLYNSNTKKKGIGKKTYYRDDITEYPIDIEKVAEGGYYLEYYHAEKKSSSYNSYAFAEHGMELAVKGGKLCFVTSPTPKQVRKMAKKYGDKDNMYEYTDKDGRRLCVYVHGQMTYVYSETKGSSLGVDYVGYNSGSNCWLVEEDVTGVVCYDNTKVKDGMYYLCVYEYNGNEDPNQNYSSIVYKDETLKVKVIDGYAAFLVPPDKDSVSKQASLINDKSKIFSTSLNDNYDIGFYIAGSKIYIYKLPDTYQHLQLNLCDTDNNVVFKTLYSSAQRAVYYDTSRLKDGNYYLQLYRYDSDGLYISDIVGSLSPEITVLKGNAEFAEPVVYRTNMRMYNPLEKVKDDYLQPEQNIESDDNTIISTANEITAGLNDDYSKALAIHDWVANNIYYDSSLAESKDVDYRTYKASAKVVLKEKTGVCAGIANLYASLLRASGIPAKKINGYALESDNIHWSEGLYEGEDSNHSWNEVYVGDRWMLVDTTWDMNNDVYNGVVTNSNGLHNHGFFDCTPEYFSVSHSYIPVE